MEKKNSKSKDNVLFTIKELEVLKTDEGNLNLIIKPSNELISFFDFFEEGRKLSKGTTEFKLTKREKDVLCLLVQGKSNAEIASELFVSRYTIKAHVANIFQKLGVEDRVQAVVKAISEEII